jgi:peptidyl-prolyl cis-trans isomerase C
MRVAARILIIMSAVALSAPQAVRGAEPKQAEPKTGVVAVVNGSEVALDDFYRELMRVERLLLDAGKPLTCPNITRLKTEVAEALVRRELLYQESKSKVKVTDAEIGSELKKLKDQYPSENEFSAALASTNISPASLRAQVERTLSIQKIIDSQFASKTSIDDKEIWSYYDKNRAAFRQPEQVKASQILVKVDPKWDEAKKSAARKKIDEIRAKLKQGQDFESLARTYSEDPSGARGGDLGYIRTGQTMKPFEEALFALKPGEVSDVVETSLGYHLIKSSDRKPETTVPFEKVKDQLRALLKQEKGRQEANAYIAKAREKARVQIFLPPDQ